jgi:hypothetical protein
VPSSTADFVGLLIRSFGRKMVISYFSSATQTENKSWAILGERKKSKYKEQNSKMFFVIINFWADSNFHYYDLQINLLSPICK